MNNLTQRLVTGVIGASVITTLMLWNTYSLVALFFLLCMFILYEYLLVVKPIKKHGDAKWHIPGNMLAGVLAFALISGVFLQWWSLVWLVLALPLIASLFIVELYQNRPQPFQHIGLRIIALVYIVLPFALLPGIALLQGSFQPVLVMGIVYTVWTDNVMAYFTGRWLGKNKLFERISPKKTWEWFVGGFIMALVCTAIFAHYSDVLTLYQWLGLGAITSITGTLGDLVESLFKRDLSLKDSSGILPGHGGFLDRFDALVMAVPFCYAYLLLLGI